MEFTFFASHMILILQGTLAKSIVTTGTPSDSNNEETIPSPLSITQGAKDLQVLHVSGRGIFFRNEGHTELWLR